MRFWLLVFVMLPCVALAQSPQQPAPPGMVAWKLMYDNAALREQNAVATALECRDQKDALTKQLADLKAPAPVASAEPGK